MNITKVEFVRSAVSKKDFPNDTAKRIVFAGKSNVGKSSTMNSLFQRKNFVKVSSSPGKTVHVNLFRVDGKYWFIDLPGYGYSKTSQAEKERFSGLIESFFQNDLEHIARLYLVVDARHKPTELDIGMVEWVRSFGVSMTVLANKTDKLKPKEIEGNMTLIRETLGLNEDDRLIPFSAEKNTNRLEVIKDIERALGEI